MKKRRAQIEAELEKKAKEVIKELMDWDESHAEPDLTQIEDIVLELREKLGKEFAASLVNNQEKVEPAVERCKRCGQEMRNKGRKRKVVGSRVGEIDLERGYYYCPECGAGIFPPGPTAESDRQAAE
jgi:uncharacterized protein with PIN domain